MSLTVARPLLPGPFPDPADGHGRAGADADGLTRVVHDLADDLAADAAARDRSGRPPHDEVARLCESGLLGALTPPAAGGTDWADACTAVREIAAADGSVGELLGRHYALTWAPHFLGAPLPAAGPGRPPLWGGTVEADGALTAVPDRHGHTLRGRADLHAGAGVAGVLLVCATSTGTGDSLLLRTDPHHPGVRTSTEADRFGQRLAGAGTVTFDDVPVTGAQLLGSVPRDEHAVCPYSALAPLAVRLVLAHVALGIAEGALAEARDTDRTRPGPRTGEDPYVLLAYGELVTAAHSASAVVDRATDALARAARTGPGLGVDARAGTAVLVTAAEAVTAEAAGRITARLLDITAGTPADCGRFWRDARALTRRGDGPHGLRDIGDYYLSGSHPPLIRTGRD